MTIQLPKNHLIAMKCAEWEKEKKYSDPDKVLERVFQQSNADFESVFIKINLLNSVYSTNISNDNILKLTMFINKNHVKLDKLISEGSIEAVNLLAYNKQTSVNLFSFATKFCSFSNLYHYPIYDQLVNNMLWQYKKQNDLNFMRKNIEASAKTERYKNFKKLIDELIKKSEIDDTYTYKDLDKFLWLTGREIKW